MIALSACHTHEPPSFSAALIRHGASVVIGTETSVTDRYSTRLFARVYNELATSPRPDVLAAVAEARRLVQRELESSKDPSADRDEWSVITVHAGGAATLFDPATSETLPPPTRQSLRGLLDRGVGEFVGRRREQRELPALLLGTSTSGVLLHGIGGVGKTTLAAQLVRRIQAREPARRAVVLTGELSVDTMFTKVAVTLRRAGLPEPAEFINRLDERWQDRDRGEYAEAAGCYRQALDINEQLDDLAGIAVNVGELGSLALFQGDYAEAERRYRQSEEISKRLGDQRALATVRHNLGLLLQRREQYTEAESSFRQALAIFELLDDQEGLAAAYCQLGTLARLRGEYVEAKRCYQRALAINEQWGCEAGLAVVFCQLGYLAQAQGDYAEAERRLRQCIDINERLGNRVDVALAYSQLAKLSKLQGRFADAVGYHLWALGIRVQLEVAEAGHDIVQLRKLRAQLGVAAFDVAARGALDGKQIVALNELLDSAADTERSEE